MAGTYISVGTMVAHIERLENQLEMIDRVAEVKKKSIREEIDSYRNRIDKKRNWRKACDK